MSTFDTLCEILVRDYPLTADALTPDTKLASLAIDSLDVIELIFAIEDAFNISVPDTDARTAGDFGTLAELSYYVDQLIAARDGPTAAEPAEAAAGAAIPPPP